MLAGEEIGERRFGRAILRRRGSEQGAREHHRRGKASRGGAFATVRNRVTDHRGGAERERQR